MRERERGKLQQLATASCGCMIPRRFIRQTVITVKRNRDLIFTEKFIALGLPMKTNGPDQEFDLLLTYLRHLVLDPYVV